MPEQGESFLDTGPGTLRAQKLTSMFSLPQRSRVGRPQPSCGSAIPYKRILGPEQGKELPEVSFHLVITSFDQCHGMLTLWHCHLPQEAFPDSSPELRPSLHSQSPSGIISPGLLLSLVNCLCLCGPTE